MFRAATTTVGEVELLRQITNVIRLGHVIRIDRDALVLENGTIPTEDDCLYVDCTARGVPNRPPVPIFDQRQDHLAVRCLRRDADLQRSASTAFIELVVRR